jgi:hypothetical protein
VVRFPFTGFVGEPGFRPELSPIARFSEPEGVLPTSAIRRRTGTTTSDADSSFCSARRLLLSLPSPWAAPSRGRTGLTSRAGSCSRRSVPAGPGSAEQRFAPSFGGRVPSSNRLRAPLSSCAHCCGRRNLSCVVRAPGDYFARTRGESPLDLRFPQLPAKGKAFRRRPRCVPPFCALVIPRIAPR